MKHSEHYRIFDDIDGNLAPKLVALARRHLDAAEQGDKDAAKKLKAIQTMIVGGIRRYQPVREDA